MSEAINEGFAGYLGPMPHREGRVCEGLPPAFAEPWQEWAELATARSRDQLGDAWLDAYLTSPVWYFALAPGLCGEAAWAGVMMPSVDRQGMYCPLTIAAPLKPETSLLDVLSRRDEWFEQAEALARSCLESDFSLAAFERDLRRLKPIAPQLVSERSSPRATRGFGTSWCFEVQSANRLAESLSAMMDGVLHDLLLAYSLWWTGGSERVEPTLLLTEGLPPADGYVAMLDGNWNRWGWRAGQVMTTGRSARPG